MDDPWKIPPANLEDQVKRYVRLATKKAINPDLVKAYARILIAATEVVAHRGRLEQATRDEVARVAAGEHGIYTDDPVEARKVYNAARRAQQEVHASAKACSTRLIRLQGLVQKRYESLPTDVVAEFPLDDVIAATEFIRRFATKTAPHPVNLAEFKMTKSDLSQTAAGHTFLWWRYYVPGHKGKWIDMHDLACCWRLTGAEDLGTFKRSVRKLKPEKDLLGRPSILRCPPWALV